jgi:hypothetical protein
MSLPLHIRYSIGTLIMIRAREWTHNTMVTVLRANQQRLSVSLLISSILSRCAQGISSLVYASLFQETLERYCIQKCAENALLNQNKPATLIHPEPVGCMCDVEPGRTTLPTVVFISPAIGLIVIGVVALFAALVGCVGSIRERPVLIYLYCCLIILIIILQLSFGGAAGAVASGSAPEIQGPLEGVLRENYKRFDWERLGVFFPPACYAGSNEQTGDQANSTVVNHYPL